MAEIQTIDGLKPETCSRTPSALASFEDQAGGEDLPAAPMESPDEAQIGDLDGASGGSKKWLLWLALGIGALVILGGGGMAAAMIISGASKKERLTKLLPIAKKVAAKNGVPLSWLLAFADHESGFKGDAIAGAGTADAERGGSFGLVQMSLKTARQLGYTGPAPDLALVKGSTYIGPIAPGTIFDAETNLTLGAKLMKQLSQSYGGRFEDVAAGYNSGKSTAKLQSLLNGGTLTDKQVASYTNVLTKYVPSVVSNQETYASFDSASS